MPELGKALVLLGAVILVVGLLLLFAGKVPFLGKLPGDIVVKRQNFTFTFPIATSIILSLLISFILYLIGKFR